MAKGKYLTPPTPQERKARIRSRIYSVIFYTLYLLMIGAFISGLSFGLDKLEDWLIRYEASQPHQKSQEIFDQLFASPDWENLYTMAGCEDTIYEDKAAYAKYMERFSGDKLTFMETSAGLSGDKKYIVKAGSEKIASFTITGGAESQTEIPVWNLGQIQLFFTRQEGVTVEKLPGYTVYINGVALDDSFTVRTINTQAEDYLPEGLHGYRMEVQQISGFLVEPDITVTNEAGEAVAVIYDSEADIYRMAPISMEISEEEAALVLNGAETYCKWMIRAVYSGSLKKCFDVNSHIYTVVRTNETWMQDYLSYVFGEKSVCDYYRYSDSMFSARVQLSLFVTRMNGTVKEYTLDTNFFFTKNEAGQYLITDMTNVDIQQQKDQVRLTFLDAERKATLDSFFADTNAKQLTLPQVQAPEGQKFVGWVQQKEDSSGKVTLTVVFTPDETGCVYLPEGTVLEPMTLFPLFEAEGSVE